MTDTESARPSRNGASEREPLAQVARSTGFWGHFPHSLWRTVVLHQRHSSVGSSAHLAALGRLGSPLPHQGLKRQLRVTG